MANHKEGGLCEEFCKLGGRQQKVSRTLRSLRYRPRVLLWTHLRARMGLSYLWRSPNHRSHTGRETVFREIISASSSPYSRGSTCPSCENQRASSQC